MSTDAPKGLEIVVTERGKAPLRFVVDAERAAIGSGAHCEVRLPPEVVAREQLLVASTARGIWFAVRSAEPEARLRGALATQGALGPDDALEVGPLSIRVSAVALTKERRRFPLELLALGPALLVAAAAFALAPRAGRAPRPPEAPALFTDEAPACPTRDAGEAAFVAEDRRALAVAKRERGPFDVGDSVEAVTQFRIAEACFTTAGDGAAAKAARDDASALRRQLEEEYLTRTTRLEHAYAEGDVDGVDREVRVLVEMTSHLHGPYTEWLAGESRRADVQNQKPNSSLL